MGKDPGPGEVAGQTRDVLSPLGFASCRDEVYFSSSVCAIGSIPASPGVGYLG